MHPQTKFKICQSEFQTPPAGIPPDSRLFRVFRVFRGYPPLRFSVLLAVTRFPRLGYGFAAVCSFAAIQFPTLSNSF